MFFVGCSNQMKELEKKAEQGDADAQFNLGAMYDEGRDVPRDYRKAFRWYSKAADQGILEAQNNLGTMYHHGEGVSQDHKKAIGWYQKAADQGVAQAQYNLGEMHYNGYGTAQDNVEAYIWLKLATDQDSEFSELFNKVADALRPDELTEADGLYKGREKAIQLRQKAAAERDV